jgi:hypothetical protein
VGLEIEECATPRVHPAEGDYTLAETDWQEKMGGKQTKIAEPVGGQES